MKYRHVLASFYSQPWAILPAKLGEIQAFLERKSLRAEMGDDDPEDFVAGPRGGGYQTVGRVAVIQMLGTLLPRCGPLEAMSGATSTQDLRGVLARAANDKAIRSIVLEIDSPGGAVAGTMELATDVANLRGEKKVVAVANQMAASAAYWIGSQAAEFYVAPSGWVGSIGVIAAHMDQSKAEELLGVKTTLVTSSPYKGELDPSFPLSEEAKADLQSKVNDMHGAFVKAVARGRGVTEARVNADFGQGRMRLAKDALDHNMVDGVATLEQVLSRLGADPGAAANGVGAKLGREARARVADIGA